MKVFKAGIYFLLSLLLMIFIFLQWPGLWLNEKSVTWLQSYINENMADLELKWSTIQVTTESQGFLKHSILFAGSNFCTRWFKLNSACFENLTAGVSYQIFPPRLTKLGPVRGLAGLIEYDVESTDDRKKEDFAFPRIPEWLKSAEIGSFYVEIDSYKILNLQPELRGKFKLTSSSQATEEGEEKSLKAQFDERQLGSGEIILSSASGKVAGPWKGRGQTQLQWPGNYKLKSNFSFYNSKDASFPFAITMDLQSSGSKAHIVATGVQRNLSFRTKLRGHIEYKEKVNLKNCTMDLLSKNEKADQWQFDFNCLAALNTKLGLKLVTHIFADMNSPAGSHLSGTFRFAPQINIPSVKSAGEMLTEFSLNTEEWPEFEKLDLQADYQVSVPHFEKLVSVLKSSPWAIPSPLGALAGPLSFSLKSDLNQEGGFVKAALKTRLQSRYQDMSTDSWGALDLKLDQLKLKSGMLKAQLDIHKIKVVLPPVLSAPGRIIKDPRIQKDPIEPKVARSFFDTWPIKYDIRIRSKSEKAIELLTPLVEGSVALRLNFKKTTNSPLSGLLEMAPFNYEIAGLSNSFGGAEMYLRASEYQTLARGQVQGQPGGERVQIMYNQNPFDSLLWPEPKLPLPMVEIATAMSINTPLGLTLLKQEQPNPALQNQGSDPVTLEIRRRY